MPKALNSLIKLETCIDESWNIDALQHCLTWPDTCKQRLTISVKQRKACFMQVYHKLTTHFHGIFFNIPHIDSAYCWYNPVFSGMKSSSDGIWLVSALKDFGHVLWRPTPADCTAYLHKYTFTLLRQKPKWSSVSVLFNSDLLYSCHVFWVMVFKQNARTCHHPFFLIKVPFSNCQRFDPSYLHHPYEGCNNAQHLADSHKLYVSH